MAWYNYDRILSFNMHFHMILTNRGFGKTFGAKKRAIDNFLKRGEQFVYVRRFKTEFKKITKFFDDISMFYEGHTFKVNGNTFYIDGKIAGYAIPLTTSQNEKSTPYPLVTTIIFDEFIRDKKLGTQYLPNEVDTLLELISTIVRKRDNWRCFLLANNISQVNPYFKYFDIKMKDDERFYQIRERGIIVERNTDDVFVEEMKGTAFGKLIANTKYSDYAIDNKALRDSDTFIERIPLKLLKPLYALQYNNMRIQVWIHKKEDLIYCNEKHVDGQEVISLVADDHDETSILNGKTIKISFISEMIKQFQVGKLRFENQDVKQCVYEIFKKLGVS